jgi:hypothetical protein
VFFSFDALLPVSSPICDQLNYVFLLSLIHHLSINLITMPIFDLATRALIIAYKADGKTNQEIIGLTGAEKRTINSIYARAIERGFDPASVPDHRMHVIG